MQGYEMKYYSNNADEPTKSEKRELLAQLLRKKICEASYSILPIHHEGSRPPIFGVHGLNYKHLSKYLGPEYPVYAMMYGLGEPPDKKIILPPMEKLAAHYIEEMQMLQPVGPYYIMGQSFAGLVALEMAQQLVAHGQEEVALLIIFDTRIGEYRRLLPLTKRVYNILSINPAELISRVISRGKFFYRQIKNPPREYYLPHVWNVGPQILVAGGYKPKAYSGRVAFFKAMNDEQYHSVNYEVDPPEIGWQKIVDDLAIHEVPGNHTNMLNEPHVQTLGKKLRDCLVLSQL
jgi:thioesterase domain-containing protein